MDKEEFLRQCLEWNKRLENWKVKPDKRYIKHKKDLEQFTEDNLKNLQAPEHDVLSICSSAIYDPKEYPIFFIRDRQIFSKEEEGLTWVYFGSLFDIENGKVHYKTTTSYIPEAYLKPFDV